MRIQTTRTLLVVLTALAAALVLSRPVEAEPPKADGERCRTNQSCQSGICEKEFGARFGVCAPSCINDPVICDDNIPCTLDSCDPDEGCTSIPVDERCPAHPTDACAVSICDLDEGCIFTPKDCNDIDACTTDSCDSFTGECEFRPINCDDNNACTEDFCDTFRGCVNNDICEG
jgi:hypothetical protein